MTIPSNRAILLTQAQSLLQASKQNTNEKFSEFNDALLEALTGLSDRITNLENNSGSGSGSAAQSGSQVLAFYLDSSGNVCQCLGNVDRNFYVPTGMFTVDNDGDLCQVIEDEEEENI